MENTRTSVQSGYMKTVAVKPLLLALVLLLVSCTYFLTLGANGNWGFRAAAARCQTGCIAVGGLRRGCIYAVVSNPDQQSHSYAVHFGV